MDSAASAWGIDLFNAAKLLDSAKDRCPLCGDTSWCSHKSHLVAARRQMEPVLEELRERIAREQPHNEGPVS